MAKFELAAFAMSGLACPPNVARSVEKRQAEFFFGRLAVRQALYSLGHPPVDLPIGASREPAWPTGLVGSISHVSGIAAAVVLPRAACSGVGIDLEHVVSDESRAALLSTAVNEDELWRLRVAQLPLNAALTIVFSAKESLFKAAFGQVGRYFDFSAARFVLLDPAARRIALEIQEDLCPTLLRGMVCWLDYRFIEPELVFTSWIWRDC